MARITLVGAAVVFGLAAAVWLVLGLVRAVDADQRMGISARANLEDIAHDRRRAMIDEAVGFAISDWTRLKKADRLIDARAAVSRSMVCLIASAILAMVLAVVATVVEPSERQPPRRGGWMHEPRDQPAPTTSPSSTPSPPASSASSPAPTPTGGQQKGRKGGQR